MLSLNCRARRRCRCARRLPRPRLISITRNSPTSPELFFHRNPATGPSSPISTFGSGIVTFLENRDLIAERLSASAYHRPLADGVGKSSDLMFSAVPGGVTCSTSIPAWDAWTAPAASRLTACVAPSSYATFLPPDASQGLGPAWRTSFTGWSIHQGGTAAATVWAAQPLFCHLQMVALVQRRSGGNEGHQHRNLEQEDTTGTLNKRGLQCLQHQKG